MCGWGSLSINWPLVIWYLQGLLTPVIAVIAAYIAWRQAQTESHKLKLDLFDRRFQAFEEVRKVFGSMFTVGINSEEITRFWFATVNAEFLFGEEIKKYREEIFRRGTHLADVNKDLSDAIARAAPVNERKKLSDERLAEVKWAQEQVGVVGEKFKKYLDLSKL
jgi:hypothetical protein